MGENRTTGKSGNEADANARSKARQIAARGDAPSAANLGSLVHASIGDVLLGNLDRRDAAATFGGVRAFVTVARNREAVDDLCREMSDAEINRIDAEKAQLKARLAELESQTVNYTT